MESLSGESHALYDLLKGALADDIDRRAREQKEAMIGAVRQMFDENSSQLDNLTEKIEAVHDEIGLELGQICLEFDRGTRLEPSFKGVDAGALPTSHVEGGGGSAPGGGSSSLRRDKPPPLYVPPPIRGTRDQNPFRAVRSAPVSPTYATTEKIHLGPRVELPKFDGTNPRLWQTRCEEYFQMWSTPEDKWISYAAGQFEGPATRWLESAQRRFPRATWGGVLSASAEQQPVRMVVAIQQPKDLDTAYELALLHEELGETSGLSSHSLPPRRAQALPLPPPPPAPRGRPLEDRRVGEVQRTMPVEDKWTAMRNYRKARGLCYVCGEKWSKDHQCKPAVQLHVVQELISHMQAGTSETSDSPPDSPDQLMTMTVSAVAAGKDVTTPTLQLLLLIQGKWMVFLVDSGSTHSFIDAGKAEGLVGVQPIKGVTVQVARGATLVCSAQVPNCSWECDGLLIHTNLRILKLGTYDGILGLDWLVQHNPMHIHWTRSGFPFLGRVNR